MMSTEFKLPAWAWLIAAGVLAYVWMSSQFPTRMEEELKHKAVEERITTTVGECRTKDIDLEQKLSKLTDLLAEHARQPYHAGTGQAVQEHAMRIATLEDNQKKVMDRLQVNEELLRNIKASLDARPHK